MMNMRSYLSLFLMAGFLVGCNDDDPIQPDPDPDEFEWIATLQGTAGFEHLSGDAGVHWVDGAVQFTAEASIAGDEPGAVRPWHVHNNTCAQSGGIVGADGDYPRLTVEEDGTASVTTTVPMSMDEAASFHVNVHLSEAAMETIIACGDLTLVGSN